MGAFSRFVSRLIGLRRAWVQLGAAVAFNSYFLAPWLKSVPCAGFNCYACPAAVVACPIGSLQHFVILRQAPLYLLGFLALVGGLVGRMACGWICPFGALQDLLHTLRVPKLPMGNRLAPVRYVIFAVLVVALPFILLEPWFCKLCPAGALEAGIPLVALAPDIRSLAGVLFAVKIGILGLFVLWMMATTRPFCRFICHLGTIYYLFNRVSGVQLRFDQGRCRQCDACKDVCPTALFPPTEIDSPGCIRCLKCLQACPSGALTAESACEHTTKPTAAP